MENLLTIRQDYAIFSPLKKFYGSSSVDACRDDSADGSVSPTFVATLTLLGLSKVFR